MKKIIKIILFGLIIGILLTVNVSALEYTPVNTIYELENRIKECQVYKEAAHEMAEGARMIGYSEDYSVIVNAKAIWAEANNLQQMYKSDLNSFIGVNNIEETLDLYELEYVSCTTVEEYKTQIERCKIYKNGAHEMAEGARRLGYSEDYCVIEVAKKEWQLGNKLQKKYQTELNELQTKNNNYFGDILLQYSAPYNITQYPLTQSAGVCSFNGHKETYYSQRILPGGGLSIPGRHVAEDGTIRDEKGYICVAADYSYLSYGSTILTSLGPGKVYDTGCAYGVIDIYVNW